MLTRNIVVKYDSSGLKEYCLKEEVTSDSLSISKLLICSKNFFYSAIFS